MELKSLFFYFEIHSTHILFKRVYSSLAVWRFKPILSAGLRFHSHLSGGLWLRNYRAVAGNHKFSSRFSVFVCFCGGYSNRVKRRRRLSGNFASLKASLFNKGLSFSARPSQSGLPSVSPAMWGGVGAVIRIIVLPVGWCRFLEENEVVCGFEGTKYGGLRNVRPPIIDPHLFTITVLNTPKRLHIAFT